MQITRRNFLEGSVKAGFLLPASPTLLRPLIEMDGSKLEPVPYIQNSKIRELINVGLDTARSAGADYADVRLTFVRDRAGSYIAAGGISQVWAKLDVAVRALVNGYWGFASSCYWRTEEVARLAQQAVNLARFNTNLNSSKKRREINFTSLGTLASGHWETPVKKDPWEMNPFELADEVYGIAMQARLILQDRDAELFGNDNSQVGVWMKCRELAFGSTEGSYYTQKQQWVGAKFDHGKAHDGYMWQTAQAGWEHITDQPVLETILERIDREDELARLPVKIIDVGRYNLLIDAHSVASLLSQTIGRSTEVDRVLGYEANATGTSFINDPDEMLGNFQLGSNLLTVSANRSEAGGVATTNWDAEGAKPRDILLLENGILQNLQTNREGAGWIKSNGSLQISSGSAESWTAENIPLVSPGNLVLHPGKDDINMKDMEIEMENGLCLDRGWFQTDFQCSSVIGSGLLYEVKNGKRIARVAVNMSILERTIDLWKNLVRLGGEKSQERRTLGSLYEGEIVKGEPLQNCMHSIQAVPAMFKDVTVIDSRRR